MDHADVVLVRTQQCLVEIYIRLARAEIAPVMTTPYVRNQEVAATRHTRTLEIYAFGIVVLAVG